MATRFTITEEATQTICGLLREGSYFEPACRLAGVNVETGREWLARGEGRHHRPPTDATRAFAEAVAAASAQAEHVAVRTVVSGHRGWQGPAWFLARRFPARWAERPLIRAEEQRAGEEILGVIQRFVNNDALDLTDEQRDAALALLRIELLAFSEAQGVDGERGR
jgi:hypothetical protein